MDFAKFSPRHQFGLWHCSQNTGGQGWPRAQLLLLDSPPDDRQGRPGKGSVSPQTQSENIFAFAAKRTPWMFDEFDERNFSTHSLAAANVSSLSGGIFYCRTNSL